MKKLKKKKKQDLALDVVINDNMLALSENINVMTRSVEEFKILVDSF